MCFCALKLYSAKAKIIWHKQKQSHEGIFVKAVFASASCYHLSSIIPFPFACSITTTTRKAFGREAELVRTSFHRDMAAILPILLAGNISLSLLYLLYKKDQMQK